MGNAKIAIGTTSAITIPVTYPNKPKTNNVYDYTYTLSYPKGDKNDFSTTLSQSIKNKTLTITLRVTANKPSAELHQIDVHIANSLTYSYAFNIVDLPAPTEYECRLDKTTLKIGESAKITAKLTGNGKKDTYLRRYFDETKLKHSSSNNAVATIDTHGVIHAKSAGSATITYGSETFGITVTDDVILKPIDNSLSLSLDGSGKDFPSLLDYDYVFETATKDMASMSEEERAAYEGDIKKNADAYSVLVYPSFANKGLEDQSVTWELSDNLKAKITPYKYDENDYPVFHDEQGRECVRICGYRNKGEVTLTCHSNADESLASSIMLNVGEAIPTTMTIKITSPVNIYVNEQKTVTATFAPKNVNNKRLHVESSNPSVTKINNNDSSSVTIVGTAVGTTHITVNSVANKELKFEFDMNFSAKDIINKDNASEFHQFIRKAAGHFSLFLVTAIIGFIFFYTFFDDFKGWWVALLASLGIGFVLADVSEWIQYCIPSRTGAWSDVCIDFSGYVIGSALALAICVLVHFLKQRKSKKRIKQRRTLTH